MRYFKAVACEREAARAERKREALLRALGVADHGSSDAQDSSLDVVHTAAPSSAAGGGEPLTLPSIVVTRLEREARRAAPDTPDTGSSATLVPSSSDSENGGPSTVDSVGVQCDELEVAGYAQNMTRSYAEDFVPGIQEDRPAEVPEVSAEVTSVVPVPPTSKPHIRSEPTTPTSMLTTPLAVERVTQAGAPTPPLKVPLMAVPVTAQMTSPATPTMTSVALPEAQPVMTLTAQDTAPMKPATRTAETPMMLTAVTQKMSATIPAAVPLTTPLKTPAKMTTTQATSATTPTATVTVPLCLPDGEGCFPTKVSVPSLCRSRSFVVDSPSLAQLLLRGLYRGGHNNANGTDIKIVHPHNSLTKKASHVSPGSSDKHMHAAMAEEGTLKAETFKVSKTFVKTERELDDLGIISQLTDGSADESSRRIIDDVHSQSGSLCVQMEKQQEPLSSDTDCVPMVKNSGRATGTHSFAKPTVPECRQVPESRDRVAQASTLPGKWDCVDARLISRAFSDTLKTFARINSLSTNDTGNDSFNTSFDNSSKVTGRVVPWTSPAFDAMSVTEEHVPVKESPADNTLHGIPNVPGDDSAEETVADDVFMDALNDNHARMSSSPLPNFCTKDNASTADSLPLFGKTVVADWDRGDIGFVPASTCSNRHSMCSSTSSIYSSSGAERDVLALTFSSSGDVEEDEELYEDVDEPHCDQANPFAEPTGSLEPSGRSLNESPSTSGSEHSKCLDHTSAADMLSTHELKLQALCQTLAQDFAKCDWSTTAALRKGAVTMATGEQKNSSADDDTPLDLQTARSTSPASAEGGSPSGHVSLPADISVSRDADHSRANSSLASTSIHLDLLSETRQSLHPKWRRCFDRLTAMARGHLTRRLMKTQRVQSIIQTIKDTLECALRLHGEPHICSGLVTAQDVELHQRLITQLTSACHELHDVFFNISTAERMHLISQLRSQKAHPAMRIAKSCMEQAPKKISLATQKVLERRLSRLTARVQNLNVEVKRPTAVVRSQIFGATASTDTCHTAGAAPSGTTRKICRLPMYKV